nr:oxidoreductase-like domain-containing protein [Thalassotalea sp. G2M2-11]
MNEVDEKPQPPADGECCDSACDPCVWDHYYAELKAWRLRQVKLKEQAEKPTTEQ